jgi:hypothetical protein
MARWRENEKRIFRQTRLLFGSADECAKLQVLESDFWHSPCLMRHRSNLKHGDEQTWVITRTFNAIKQSRKRLRLPTTSSSSPLELSRSAISITDKMFSNLAMQRSAAETPSSPCEIAKSRE